MFQATFRTPDDIINAMEFVRRNFTELSKNARAKYEQIWADWNFKKYYSPVLRDLGIEGSEVGNF